MPEAPTLGQALWGHWGCRKKSDVVPALSTSILGEAEHAQMRRTQCDSCCDGTRMRDWGKEGKGQPMCMCACGGCVHVCACLQVCVCVCVCLCVTGRRWKGSWRRGFLHACLGAKRFLRGLRTRISCRGKTGVKTGKEAGAGSRWALSARPLS